LDIHSIYLLHKISSLSLSSYLHNYIHLMSFALNLYLISSSDSMSLMIIFLAYLVYLDLRVSLL